MAEEVGATDRLASFRAFADSLSDGVIITTTNLDSPGPRIVYVNDALSRITKYTSDELIGATPRIFQGPKSDRAVLGRLRQELTQKHKFFDRIVNYDKDGGELILDWHISAIYDQEGIPAFWVSVQRCVSEPLRVNPGALVRALVVHPNHLMRSGLRSILEKTGRIESVDETTDYIRGREIVRDRGKFELILAAWGPPGLGSLDDLKALHSATLPASLAVLATPGDIGDVATVFEAGAKAYIPEVTDGETMVEIVRLVLSGGTYAPWQLTQSATRPGNATIQDATAEPLISRLTKRQKQILALLAEGLSNEEIGQRLGLKLPTVKAHVGRTLKALGAKNRIHAALMFQRGTVGPT